MTPYCRHIKTNGRRCCSMAMRGKALCYFHSGLNARHRTLKPSPPDTTPTILHSMQKDPGYYQRNPLEAEYWGIQPPPPILLDFPALEDRESIQVALSMLLSALAHNRIDNKSAGLLLYGLQVASANAKTLGQQSDAPTVSETILDDTGQELALDEDPAEIAQDTTRIGFTENLLNELLLRSAADLIATLIDQLEPHDPAAAIVARKQAAPFHLNEVAGNGPPPSPAT